MIHFGKEPDGWLNIRVSPDDVGEVYDALQSAGLLQRRTFHDLKTCIERDFKDDLAQHRRRTCGSLSPAARVFQD